MNVRLYLTEGMPARERVADHLADAVDLLLAVRLGAEHDCRTLAARDLRRAHRQWHHVERDSERLDALAKPRQAVDRPRRAHRRRRQPAADVIHAEAGEHFQDLVGVAVLRPDLHACPRGCAGRGRPGGDLGFDQRFCEALRHVSAVPANRAKSRRFMIPSNVNSQLPTPKPRRPAGSPWELDVGVGS